MSHLVLETLFESPVKVKLLKLFLRNPGRFFHEKEIAKKLQAPANQVKKQLDGFLDIAFLQRKTVIKNKKDLQKGIYFSVSSEFSFYHELRSLILKSSPASKEKILNRVQKLGNIKLLLLAGVFLNSDNSRLDLFIVGDRVNQAKLDSFLRDLEAEVGKDIAFALMSAKEFNYRFHMFDRFVHDILEKPNEKLVNKIRI